MTDCLSVCLSLFINSFYSIQQGDQAVRSHTRREMMSPVKHPLSVTTQSAEETPPQHSNAHTRRRSNSSPVRKHHAGVQSMQVIHTELQTSEAVRGNRTRPPLRARSLEGA